VIERHVGAKSGPQHKEVYSDIYSGNVEHQFG